MSPRANTSAQSRDDLRVGLIGYGLAGAMFHAPLITATAGLRMAAVVTRDPDRATQASRDHPDARVVPTAADLWERAGELDVVVIASPNRTHVPLATSALEARLHTVVDKPLARTAAEARRLVEAARQSGRLLTVFQNRRWDGDFLTVRNLIEQSALGTVHRFESRFERWRPTPKGGWRERGAPEEVGGLLYDLGSHLVDQALLLFGPAAHVYGELDQRRPSVEVDDDAFIAIAHRSGARSHLWMSAVAGQPGPRFRVLGSNGAYVKHGLDVQEAALRGGGARPGDPGWGEEPREHWGSLGAGEEVYAVPTARGAYERFYELLVEAIRNGSPPPVDPHDAIGTLGVLEAAVESSADRTTDSRRA
ncbi:MAG TPA: Gfo/Idh/MocA family oxidoreductase [Gemmatimonadaceae bacterium]|nr:Gfo/Idh/MocA family oxidoreductase [Gemmatimonadaceae bacterium]